MSARRMLWLSVFVSGLALTAGSAAAQCCAPPPPCCAPPPPPPPPSCNCGGGHTVVVPGVNVSVQSTAIAVSGASASAGSGASAGSTVFVGGGGGGWYVEQQTPTLIQNLNVEASVEATAKARVAVQSQRKVARRVIVQASCIDDRSVPHPASQVKPDREVADDYEGEIYRCIAGTRLQATWADYGGQDRVDGGETLGCEKMQALYHAPGGGLECRAQKPARDCNERSLLRRYGAGVKLVSLVRTETFTEYREEAASASGSATARASAGGALMLDGGVGGVVH
jgi:hypothetical protein